MKNMQKKRRFKGCNWIEHIESKIHELPVIYLDFFLLISLLKVHDGQELPPHWLQQLLILSQMTWR
jgi:hypothetical protein